MKKILGIRGLETGIGAAGVGFVVVPAEVDREEYIEDCYRTNTVTMNGGRGCGYFSGVNVDVNVMQNITFPADEENRGTAVIWVKDSVSKLPIIVASLRKQGDYYNISENQYKVSRGNETRNVDIFIDGNESSLQINILGDEQSPSVLAVKVTSKNEDSEVVFECDNKITIISEKELDIISNTKTCLRVTEDGEDITTIVYEKGVGLTYKDEFDNEIICEEDKVTIRSKEIHHGDGKEPMVLGDKLAKLLEDTLTAIQKLTVITPVGTSSPPVNIADFVKIQGGVDSIKSEISKLD